MNSWRVICRPVASNPIAGLSVVLTDGEEDIEISRVAFMRDHAKNPERPFVAQLQDELDKAEEASATVNELQDEFEAIELDKATAARQKIRDLFGEPTTELV